MASNNNRKNSEKDVEQPAKKGQRSFLNTMPVSVIAIGNPGAGKSTILNSLAGELLFKSGISIGEGLTYQLDERENARGRFFDTPGLADDTHREAAGKAISTALRKGGPYRILFFMRTESGRIVREDITTLKLVLEAAPEIGKQYAIVANKIPKEVATLLEKPKQAEKLLTKMFIGIPEQHRCPMSNMTYLPVVEEADNQDNKLVPLEKFITIRGSQFKDFFYYEMPIVNLTKGLAKEVATSEYDKMDKMIEALEKKMEEDKEMFEKQQKLLVQQLAKAEKEKEEQRQRDQDMFNQQMNKIQQQMDQKDKEIEAARNQQMNKANKIQQQMDQKDKEIEAARNDRERCHTLELEEMKLQNDNDRQIFQEQMAEESRQKAEAQKRAAKKKCTIS